MLILFIYKNKYTFATEMVILGQDPPTPLKKELSKCFCLHYVARSTKMAQDIFVGLGPRIKTR